MPGLEGIDTTRANQARVYDYWLGGKDNFAADRKVGEDMARKLPALPAMACGNRKFVTEAAALAARDGGIRQFLDLGSGLPTAGPEKYPEAFTVHLAVRKTAPDATVTYVDHDDVVLLHARALLAGEPGISAVHADLAEPDALLDSLHAAGGIALEEPVAVILGAVLHFYDPDEARRIISGYMSRLAPGSWLIASVFRICDEDMFRELAGMYTAGQVYNHSAATFESFFDGVTLVGPGVAELNLWRAYQRWVSSASPEDARKADAMRATAAAGRFPARCQAYMMAGAGIRR